MIYQVLFEVLLLTIFFISAERLCNRHLDLADINPSDLEHFSGALRADVQGIQVDFDDGHCPTWRNQIYVYTMFIERCVVIYRMCHTYRKGRFLCSVPELGT